jgi:hypothetical protein
VRKAVRTVFAVILLIGTAGMSSDVPGLSHLGGSKGFGDHSIASTAVPESVTLLITGLAMLLFARNVRRPRSLRVSEANIDDAALQPVADQTQDFRRSLNARLDSAKAL